MGSTVAASAACNLSHVLFASEGRSSATIERAEQVDLEDVGSLSNLVECSQILVSVCPPASAMELANRVASLGFRGIYVDANALSPATARKLEQVFAGQADFVDGALIGPPAHRPNTTRLHLSGARSEEVARCFAEGPLEACVIDGPVGAASALKMVFAAYTKGSAALLAAIHAVARVEGVDAELIREWQQSIPDLPGRLKVGSASIAPKAWRFVGEMHEIAATFEAAGLPPGFFEAAAEVYERLAEFKDVDPSPGPDEVAERLRRGR